MNFPPTAVLVALVKLETLDALVVPRVAVAL